MILAGDIGGTKTILALYSKNKRGELQCELEQTFVSANYAQFNTLLADFLPKPINIHSACLGIAGPIVDQCCQTTNLPWIIDAQELTTQLGTPNIQLLNDLEAMALGILNSPPEDLIELNPNAQAKKGNIAVIAAGTGLGEAILYWDGKQHHPIATEGGHCDFASQNVQQDKFLLFLRQQLKGHISWERVLSGDGLGYLYDFLVETNFAPANREVNTYSGDRNALISQLGINNEDPLCTEVIRLFVELYAAEAGNLSLKCLATGGLFIGGGIAPKIRSALLQNNNFLHAFIAKGRFEKLLNNISIKLSLNPKAPLIGAANYFGNRDNITCT